MKSIVLLSLLVVLASGQNINVPITVVGNSNGSVTITAGTYGTVTMPSGTKSAVQGLLSLVGNALGSVQSGTKMTFNLPIAINGGTATVTVNGQSYVVDAASVKALTGVLNQLNMAFSG